MCTDVSVFQANVEGVRCDRCKVGSFGLSHTNPLGCSQCYCFGLSSSCTEATGLIRMRVSDTHTHIISNAYSVIIVNKSICFRFALNVSGPLVMGCGEDPCVLMAFLIILSEVG